MNFRLDASLQNRWIQDEEAWQFEMPSDWMQGRSVFGGVTAAAAVALGGRVVGSARMLRTMNIHLVRPTTPGPVRGDVQIIRQGKNVTFAQVSLSQDRGVTASATLVFAQAGASNLETSGTMPLGLAEPDSLPSMPHVPGVVPDFVKQVDLKWLHGSPPFSGSETAEFGGYCRFRVPAGSAEGVVALLDVWPCPSLSQLAAPAPASTVAWTAHIVESNADLSDWCYFTYKTVAGKDGFHTCAGTLFDGRGVLIGFTEQLVAVYG
jgi:acyl-CoA thioesterase